MESLVREGARLTAALEEDPEQQELWMELAVFCRQAGFRPNSFDPLALLPYLTTRILSSRGDPELVSALLAVLGAELPEVPGEPEVYWSFTGRSRRAGGHWIDSSTGLPLELVRRRDGARMLLVAWGMPRPGQDGPGKGLALPSRKRSVSLLYLDRQLVSADQFQALCGRGAIVAGEGPARVEGFQAMDYASRVGGELPTELEWCRPRTLSEARDRAPEFRTPHLDAEDRREIRRRWYQENEAMLAQESAFGIQYPPEPEWTSTPYATYLAALGAETPGGAGSGESTSGGADPGNLVRAQGHLSVHPLRGATFAFRVAFPVGPIEPQDQHPRRRARSR